MQIDAGADFKPLLPALNVHEVVDEQRCFGKTDGQG
jgi:hypothetical protein